MMALLSIILICLINIVSFATMGMDKSFSKKRSRRIPEKYLFRIAIFGGALGMLLGMKHFRHKTLHKSFKYGIPSIVIIHIMLASVFLFKISS